MAATVIGDAEKAFDIYKRSCPAFLEDVSEIHRTEPYVYSQMIAGRAAVHYGEAKNSFLTGTAAWVVVDITQAILGVQPTLQGLAIKPCVTKDFGSYNVVRKYRGAKYDISVIQDGSGKGLVVDGAAVEGNLVPAVEGKKEYKVEFYI